MGDGPPSNDPAITINARVATPSLFSQYYNDYGRAAFVQLCKLDNYLKKGLYTLKHTVTDGYVLDLDADDTDWPYEPPWVATLTWDPSSGEYRGGRAAPPLTDNPGYDSFVVGGLSASNYSIEDMFKDWVMFIPPGPNPEWVPSQGPGVADTWRCESDAEKPWPTTPPGGASVQIGLSPSADHPRWTGNHRSS